MGDAQPTFTFPPPGFDPANSTEGLEAYIQSAVANAHRLPQTGFGAFNRSSFKTIRSEDLIEPRWNFSSTAPPVVSLAIHCLSCLPIMYLEYSATLADIQAACTYDISPSSNYRAQDRYTSRTIENVRPGGEDTRIEVPMPNAPEPAEDGGLGVQISACLLALLNEQRDGQTKNTTYSQLFWSYHKNRAEILTWSETLPYVYSSATPNGTRASQDYRSYSATPTPTSRPTPICEGSGRAKSCEGDGKWNGWPVRNRVGVVLGATAGLIILLLIVWYFCGCKRPRWEQRALERREKQKPMTLSEYRAEQQRAREEQLQAQQERDRSEREARNARLVALSQNAGTLGTPLEVEHRAEHNNGDAVVKQPPAYAEVINDHERFLAQHAIQRNARLNGTPGDTSPLCRADATHPQAVNNANESLPYYSPPVSGTLPYPSPRAG